MAAKTKRDEGGKRPEVSPGWVCRHCGADNLHSTGRLTCRVCRYGKGRDPLPMQPTPPPAPSWRSAGRVTIPAIRRDRCR